MANRRCLRNILIVWGTCVLLLAVAAPLAQRLRQDRIAAQAVSELIADAESGNVEDSDYLYSFGWQGPMVDLIERGRHYPDMERVMLLLEARRVKDWVYLYPRYRNADLRSCLMRHGLEHYPDDPLVHWAVGRLKLISGEYSAAADELTRAIELGFDPVAANVPEEHLRGRIVTALIMAGRSDEAVDLLRQRYVDDPQDGVAAYEYFDLLCRVGQYSEVIADLGQLEADGSLAPDLWSVLLRAYFWSGDIDSYRRSASQYSWKFQDTTSSQAEAMLALLDSDFASALARVDPPQEPEWWMEWNLGWDYFRLLADAYAATGDRIYLNELRSWMQEAELEIERLQGSGDSSWQQQQEIGVQSSQLDSVIAQLARARAMRGEWEDAAQMLENTREASYYRNDLSLTAVKALVAISQGQELEQHSLASMASTGAVVDLLLSQQLSEATTAAGKPAGWAREQLLNAAVPEQSNYWWYEDQVLDW